MEKNRVMLVGGGGHARVVADCLDAQGHTLVGFFSEHPNSNIIDLPALGAYETNLNKDDLVIVAIGDNKIRKKVVGQVRHLFSIAVHPSVILSKRSVVGEGSMLLHGAIIQPNVSIGRHVILNTGSQVDHDSVIDDFVHLAPGSTLCGNVSVGEGTLIGAGATVIPQVKIGKWCIIGAGSVVIRDVPDYSVVVGNPSKILRSNG